MLVIEYTLTEREYLDYNYYTAWQSPARKKVRTRYYLTYLGFYILILLVALGTTSGLNLSSLLVAIVVVALLILYVHFRMRSIFNRRARKMITETGHERIFSKTTLTISETGISGHTPYADVKYQWSAFQRKAMVNNCYYLYLTSVQGLVIPTRSFTSTQEKEAFDQLLLQYFPLQAELKQLAE